MAALGAILVLTLAAPGLLAQPILRSMYVSVLDEQGAPVPDLGPSDFIVREDNVAREVLRAAPATEPMQVAVLVDNSAAAQSGINDLRRALRVARRIESGVLSINSHSSVHVEAPFGGFKHSGIGRDLGMAAMEGCTELKNIYVAEN